MSLTIFSSPKFGTSSTQLLPRSTGRTQTQFKYIGNVTTSCDQAINMVITRFGTSSSTQLLKRISKERRQTQVVRCIHKSCDQAITSMDIIPRRLANYHPSIWQDDYLQSLLNHYTEETLVKRANELKEEVRGIFGEVEDPLMKLELIDTLQRLGVSYHFEHEIKNTLESIYNDYYRSERWNKEEHNLFAMALEFRILRQHGYNVPQEVFNKFKDNHGNFKSSLREDTKGMLYFYEASFLSTRGESILDKARDFTAKTLKEHLKNKNVMNNVDETLDLLVDHALELPLHWRMLRLEARWFIDVYGKKRVTDSTLLEFAKLDFNMVQASYQEELKQMSRWWKSTYLGEKLRFARDRLMENYFWTTGVIFEPNYEYCRRMTTKVNALITTIDDIYDVYGSLQELQLFTNAVQRWDINAVDELPEYMKICFLALYNSTNEMAYNTLVQKGVYVISHLTKAWADLCESYLMEARWYYKGYTPTFEEYMENAWISISAPLILVQAHFHVTNTLTTNFLDCLKEYPNIVRWSSVILRLANDLGTSTDELKRGDIPKSIQCYMHETGASEEEAREHVKYLIGETWKKLNEEVYRHHQDSNSTYNDVFVGIAMNLARMAQCMYQHGDGHGIENKETKDRVLALLINPIK